MLKTAKMSQLNKGRLIMETFNPKNERIKYQYRIFLARAKKKDEKTWFAVMKHLKEFETFTNFANFESLNETIINNYIEHLLNKDLSLSHIDHNIKTLKSFYTWLERQKGYKSKIDYNILEFFSLSSNQRKQARATEYKESYELEEIFSTIHNMPNKTILERRNKVMVSLQALCGLRVSELRTVRLKNLIFDKQSKNWMIYVNPKDMNVKFAKTRCAFFMPFADDIKENILSWKEELERLEFKDKDPLFPIIPSQFNQLNLLIPQLKKDFIKSNTTIRDIFKKAFLNAGYNYLRPHSFRHSIVRWAETQSPQFFNAVSQSLGHSDIKTTFQSYGALTPSAIGSIVKNTSNDLF